MGGVTTLCPSGGYILQRIVPAVDVPVEALGVAEVCEDGVGGDEPADLGVVVPGPEVVQAGGVLVFAGVLELLLAGAAVVRAEGLVVAGEDLVAVAVGLEAGAPQVVLVVVLDGAGAVLGYVEAVGVEVIRCA